MKSLVLAILVTSNSEHQQVNCPLFQQLLHRLVMQQLFSFWHDEDGKPYNVHKYNLYCQINIYDETGSSVSYVLERVKGENERYNFKTTMLDKKFLDIYTFHFTKSETELPCY